ncbi:murein L,D-transpeptidase [Peteryoungia desertarenae]|uniref:Murein L,D-transpeptidase n=1 Tax=Peteryoungia desertarenae TaxID=1813451 RepID=A0ABX6QJF3_9HYPH|nr:murein L,D-transpeptidase family protein [Peteryoungia desertarenae]QLF68607.1 murein L,D-transpeptidase [Peteryoungia desertarenae]
MRWTHTAILLILAGGLVGCNDALESVDPRIAANKVHQPLPPRILNEMKKKGMPRNSPIAFRIFKEEGILEVWKAKADNRFEKIVEYEICAWSGRLGPKFKEGDRQAPEGFYPLSQHHLNPNSKYFLAINTGYPNRFDQANGRTGTHLMIHGACSSSGCYSMTDAQMLEIYAFARDAFAGGQQNIQLQAFPFRMTAENMARHRHSPHIEFWQNLKVGYDNFEVTKRPPEVNVCDRRYVFNMQAAEGKSFVPTAACPPMSKPPALEMALASYNKAYDAAYEKALKKYDGKIWIDPTEAERKALVADLRKSRAHDLAFAPTGSALKAGRLARLEDVQNGSASAAVSEMAAPAANETTNNQSAPAANTNATVAAAGQSAPIPQPNPMNTAQNQQGEAQTAEKKPFWKIW